MTAWYDIATPVAPTISSYHVSIAVAVGRVIRCAFPWGDVGVIALSVEDEEGSCPNVEIEADRLEMSRIVGQSLVSIWLSENVDVGETQSRFPSSVQQFELSAWQMSLSESGVDG
jgi:hypothetical protein